jgi:hypothetical protein
MRPATTSGSKSSRKGAIGTLCEPCRSVHRLNPTFRRKTHARAVTRARVLSTARTACVPSRLRRVRLVETRYGVYWASCRQFRLNAKRGSHPTRIMSPLLWTVGQPARDRQTWTSLSSKRHRDAERQCNSPGLATQRRAEFDPELAGAGACKPATDPLAGRGVMAAASPDSRAVPARTTERRLAATSPLAVSRTACTPARRLRREDARPDDGPVRCLARRLVNSAQGLGWRVGLRRS